MNIYEFCYSYLLKQTSGILTKEQVDSFISEVDSTGVSSLEEIYKMLVVCLQDYQAMPRVINFFAREEQIKAILNDYDVYKVSKRNYVEIYEIFKQTFNPKIIDDNKNSWRKFARGVYESACFLSKFKNANEFVKFINTFQYNVHTKLALPLLLSTEIYGLGFALACNWLKELGFKDYPKPDVHMIDVFSSIDLCTKDPISCYKAMVKIADDCNIDAYALDKVVWLICSGNYYRYNLKSQESAQKLKERFIKELKLWKAGNNNE